LSWKRFFEMAKAMIPEGIHRHSVRILMQDAAVEGLPERGAKFNSMPTSYPQA
jgi:hypothetical protein